MKLQTTLCTVTPSSWRVEHIIYINLQNDHPTLRHSSVVTFIRLKLTDLVHLLESFRSDIITWYSYFKSHTLSIRFATSQVSFLVIFYFLLSKFITFLSFSGLINVNIVSILKFITNNSIGKQRLHINKCFQSVVMATDGICGSCEIPRTNFCIHDFIIGRDN